MIRFDQPTAYTLSREEVLQIKNRVRYLRERKGWTQQELSDRTGISRPNISNYERGAPIGPGLQKKLAQALGVGIGELFDEMRPMAMESDRQLVGVPFLGRIVASPDGKEYFDGDVPEGATVPFFKNHGSFFALEVENDSLINAQPEEIYPGDICIFDSNRQPRNGDIVAVQFIQNNQRTVKLLFHNGTNEIELRSANKFRNYPSLRVRKDEVNSFGVYVGKIKISDDMKRQYGLRR